MSRFSAEEYEVGGEAMERDAALDAMHVDLGHENALGMEGVDVYQNQLATLSGKLDSMSTAGGIDFDGDGTIDVSASKPGQMMKYSEFKPPGLSVETGVSMFQDPACELKDYAPEANGIIPGYAGHFPRARDKYGGSAHNGCSVAIHGHKHIGPQIAHQKTEALGNRYGTDGLPLPPKAVEPRYSNYKEKVQGVMPGYGGFRPGARDECGFATVGGIQRFGEAETRGAHPAPKPEFVGGVRGVLPGYTGYVPTSKNTHGISHYGSLPGGHHNMRGSGAQKGHIDVKGDRHLEVSKNIKSGYAGHVPQSRDTFGGAHYGVGSYDSPDLYNEENARDGVVRHNQDMRLVTGSDAGNSDYASDGGGKFFGQDAHNAGAAYHNHALDDEPPPSQVAGSNLAAMMAVQGISQKNAPKFGSTGFSG